MSCVSLSYLYKVKFIIDGIKPEKRARQVNRSGRQRERKETKDFPFHKTKLRQMKKRGGGGGGDHDGKVATAKTSHSTNERTNE